jgi:phage tail-like protein
MAAATPTGPIAPEDPFRAYNFKLIVQNVTEGHFMSCSALGMRVEPIAYREAGNHGVVRQLPGQVEYAQVTLRYGLTRSKDLFDWILGIAQGRIDRRNVSLSILETDGSRELTRWNLYDAWPSEWRGSTLDVMRNEVAIESLTLVYDRLDRDAGTP